MKRRRYIHISIVLSMFVVALLASQMTVMAAAPKIDDIKHKGKGSIKVEFCGKVKYKNVKVTVKDINGKKYKVKGIKKDNDDIRFTIVKYREGETYKITVSGVKKKGTGKYGKVSGRCTISPIVTSDQKLSYQAAEHIARDYWKIPGDYIGSGYNSNGLYIFSAYNEDGMECGSIHIDDKTGKVEYLEYKPVELSYTLIFKNDNTSLNDDQLYILISQLFDVAKRIKKIAES